MGIIKIRCVSKLAGGFNQPNWKKYDRQIGSCPQVGVKKNKL